MALVRLNGVKSELEKARGKGAWVKDDSAETMFYHGISWPAD